MGRGSSKANGGVSDRYYGGLSVTLRDIKMGLQGMEKQAKIDYLETLIETSNYRKANGKDTTTVDAIIKLVQDDLNGKK